MTVNQFIGWLNEHRGHLSGDETLAVRASGGLCGSGHAVDQISVGFDWDSGKVILTTKTPLTLDTKAIARLKAAKKGGEA